MKNVNTPNMKHIYTPKMNAHVNSYFSFRLKHEMRRKNENVNL